jgi:antitoxin HicB
MRNMDYYLSLNYHKRLYQDEDGGWVVELDDLPGCVADGKTPDEAVGNLRDAMTSWISSRIDARLDVPEPTNVDEYSGRILLRMPKFLHRRLSLQAKFEGVSLNQYISSLLADASARASVVSQAAVQNVPTLPFKWSWEPVVGSCLVNAGFGQPNSWYSCRWVSRGVEESQCASLFFNQAAPKQLLALQAPKETA